MDEWGTTVMKSPIKKLKIIFRYHIWKHMYSAYEGRPIPNICEDLDKNTNGGPHVILPKHLKVINFTNRLLNEICSILPF